MDRYICIHGHFYQPPRENPWLEAIEIQDSAYPYHDWNERITAECYGPNAVARMLDADRRIVQLVNNYARISFNFGPTLLAWMREKAPDVYQAVLDADRESRKRFGGHGSALAQVYNHVIMPLASRADKVTQVVWGIRDFERRFGREPEGMWLPETAADVETLEVLAEHGIRFTVLAPSQAARVRRRGDKAWQDVSGGRIDPKVAYAQRLPSGRSIGLFFYDGPAARAIAFEGLLAKGENLANRLMAGFAHDPKGPQLVHVATDGESYGHHHHHGDMALAYALHQIEAGGAARLTNYGEFLERFPPEMEVEILERTSWSCAHGVERWYADCGCNSGRRGWHQRWRGPLRVALDWLRDAVAPEYERHAAALLRDPWAARNAYVAVLLDRTPEAQERFLDEHARRGLDGAERVRALKLMELQRHAQLMYTSCGWFFDEISGLETVQVLMYAGRVLQLAEELFEAALRGPFLEWLEKAAGNLREHGNGRQVFEKFVEPARLDWDKIGAHYAVSSLFEAYPKQTRMFAYQIDREEGRSFEAGKVKLVVGHATLTSEVTTETTRLAYGSMHFGDHNVHGGVRPFDGADAHRARADEFAAAFARVDYAQIVRLMDRHFGDSYSLGSLFRDEQRKVLKRVLRANLDETTGVYGKLYEQNLPLMRFLKHLGVPLPLTFRAATEVLFNTDLRWAFADDDPDFDHIRTLVGEAANWGVPLDLKGLGYKFTKMLSRTAERWREQPDNSDVLLSLTAGVELARALPFEPDLWKAQNVYFEMTATVFPRFAERNRLGDPEAREWLDRFLRLGELLGVEVEGLKKK